MLTLTKNLDFDAIRLKLASPEEIHGWSHGEVTKPETINYRTQKPEKDGLFSEAIFGPSKDWECYCGKYKKIRYKGIICDKCGVEVTHSLVRRERMGHINLAVPVSHIWFLRSVPSKIGLVLDLSVQNLEKVIYFADFIITEVNEELKETAVEKLKQEFKSKKKQLENEYNQKLQALKAKGGADKAEEKAQVKLNEERDAELLALEADYELNEKELKDLKPLKIISENTYHDLSLKYGYLFGANIGAEAIALLLKQINLKETIADLEEKLPSAIGLKKEKLIRRLKLLKNLEFNKIRPEWMIMNVIPIIPPDLRPMVPLDGGRFATSDLNDLYRRVINRNNRLKRLIELNAPEVICRNEKRMLQEAVDALIDNSARHTKTTTASTGQKRELKSLADILKGKQGRFRQNLLGKRIDYSGRSVIVVGPTLKLNQCGLPKKMALELFRPFVISQIIQRGLAHNIRSANRFIEADFPEVWDILEGITSKATVLLNRAPTLHRLGIQAFHPLLIEGSAIQVHPLVCTAFNADFDGDQMAVHVPLTEEAKKEAEEIMLSSNNLLKPATGQPVVSPGKDIVLGCYYMTTLAEPKENETLKSFADPGEAILAYNLRRINLQTKIKARLPVLDSKGKVKKYNFLLTSVGRILFNRVLPADFPFQNKVIDVKGLGEIVRLSLEKYGKERAAKLLDDTKELGFRYITKAGFSWSMEELPQITEKNKLVHEGDAQVDEIQKQYEEGLLTFSERYNRIIEIWSGIKNEVVKLCKTSLDKNSSVYAMVDSGARGTWGQLTQMIGMKGLVSNPAGEIIELPVKANFKEGFDVLEYFISTHGSRKGLSDTALRTANAGYLTRRLVDVSQDVVVRALDCGDEEGITLTKKETEEIGEPLVTRIIGRTSVEKIIDPKTKKTIVGKNEIITEAIANELAALDPKEIRIRSGLTCKMKKGICQHCYGYDLAHNKLVLPGTAVGIIAAQSIGEPGTQLTMRTFHTGGVASGSDITQGLPRVEEIFEARLPKRKAILSDVAGKVKIIEAARVIEENGKKILATARGQKTIQVSYEEMEEKAYKIKKGDTLAVSDGAKVKKDQTLYKKENGEEVKAENDGEVKIEKNTLTVSGAVTKIKEFIPPMGYLIWVKDGDLIPAGAQLTDGSLDLHELYALRGKTETQKYILKEIQYIYSSQGQKLNDKHIEVIIRQLFSRLKVTDAGDTSLLPGEIVEESELEEVNKLSEKKDGKPAVGEELFLGITKVSLSTRSFLSAASFQETSRVLINAAISGKIDYLEGLKENVIIGRLIPAGTGFNK